MFTVYVLAVLTKGNDVLLIRRCNATFGNGLYSLVGGKLEHNEPVRRAIKREVLEEVALDIPESMFTLVHTFHRKGPQSDFLALCFKADITTMHPINNEPLKHDDMQFFSIDALPITIVPAHAQAIKAIACNSTYSEHGWE